MPSVRHLNLSCVHSCICSTSIIFSTQGCTRPVAPVARRGTLGTSRTHLYDLPRCSLQEVILLYVQHKIVAELIDTLEITGNYDSNSAEARSIRYGNPQDSFASSIRTSIRTSWMPQDSLGKCCTTLKCSAANVRRRHTDLREYTRSPPPLPGILIN